MCFVAAPVIAGAAASLAPAALSVGALTASLAPAATLTSASLGAASFAPFAFLTSPGFSLATNLIGFGVQMIGQQQQFAFAREQMAYQHALTQRRIAAVEQDIKLRQQQLLVDQGIIGARGKEARGDLRVSAAGRGVLVDVGSEADKTEQLAGEVAFAKLVEEQKVNLANRQDRITAQGLAADSALADFKLSDAKRASVFGQVGTALQTASGFSKFRFNKDGQLAFRT